MILYPLTFKQMKSMRAMQELQPKIKELQAKYQGKPEQSQKAVMELYKQYKVNPFAGCLPLVLQMPILFALFSALRGFKYTNADHASFLWVSNLSVTTTKADPYFLLPIIVGLTTYLQSKLTTPNATDPNQKMMLYIMPVVIGFMSLQFPAGLALYWAVFNVVGAIQQYFINRHKVVLKGETSPK